MVKKDSKLKLVSSSLSIGSQTVRSSKQVIRTGYSSKNQADEEMKDAPDEFMQYLTRHQANMLKRLSPRSMKRYTKILSRQKEQSKWTNAIYEKKISFQEQRRRQSLKPDTMESSKSFAEQAAKGKYFSSASGKAISGTASGAATTTATGAATSGVAAGGTLAAGAATGGTALAGAAATKVSKKIADKIKDNLTAMMAERKEQVMEFKAQTNENQKKSGFLGLGNSKSEGESQLLVYLGVFLVIVLLLFSSSSTYLIDLTIDQIESAEEDWNLISIAKAELADATFNVGGYKYKYWYGMDDNWCAMFVSYCAEQCGYIESGIMPKTASVSNMIQWYMNRGQYRPAGFYTPKGGDIIFFGNGMSHTGIVISYDPARNMVLVIEGNSGSSSTKPYHKGSRVRAYNYSVYYKYIVGYGVPNYATE